MTKQNKTIKVDCPDCGEDWGHSYCGTCKGTGSIVRAMTEQEAFLEHLKENEDDTFARMVYADWLDEHGLYDEADRQRAWPAAKKWIVDFCNGCNVPEYEDVETPITYEKLMVMAANAHSENIRAGVEVSIYCGDNETLCQGLRDNHNEFWKNWSIVTGKPLNFDLGGPYMNGPIWYRCGC